MNRGFGYRLLDGLIYNSANVTMTDTGSKRIKTQKLHLKDDLTPDL